MDEVLIIGGGIIGLSIARGLYKKGAKKIRIIEQSEAGKGASFAAAGMLSPSVETLKKDPFYEFCEESRKSYPGFIEELADESGINPELDRKGTLYISLIENDSAEIYEKYKKQKGAGLNAEFLSANEIKRLEPFISPEVREGIFYPDDWQIENRKLLLALRKYAAINGFDIIENARAVSIKDGRVETSQGDFSAGVIILATGAWTSLIKTDDLNLPLIKPIRGEMVNFRTAKKLFDHVIYSPRCYIVPRSDGRILIGATSEDAGFEIENTEAGIGYLQESGFEIVPSMKNLAISDKWAGLRPMAADGLPVLGEAAENIYIATAHFRNGILLAPKTAEIIADRILDGKNSIYLDQFGPKRFQKKSYA